MSLVPRTAEGHAPRLGYMPQLDALRAFAVLAVLVGHAMPWIGEVVPLAQAGVRLFFVLSGYLITALLLRYREQAEGGGRWGALARFYVRRGLRIWPLYFFIIALALAFDVGPVHEVLPWLLTHTVNFCIALRGEWVDGFFHFWTLAVEEQFYLAWPLVVLFAPRRLLLPVTLGLIAVGPLYRGWAVSHGWGVIWTYCPTPACFDTLGAGALLALLLHNPARAGGVDRGLRLVALPAGLAAVVLLSVLRRYGVPWPQEILFDLALALVFSWLVRSAGRGVGGLPGWVLGARPILYLGTISYGVYAYHVFLPEFLPALTRTVVSGLGVSTPTPGWLRIAAFAVCLIAVPMLSWHFLEKPINALKDSLGRRPAAGPATPGVSRKRGHVTLAACAVVVLAPFVGEFVTFWEGRVNREFYDRRAREEGDARPRATYYVSPSGDDDNPGTFPDAAWRTLDRVNRTSLGAGDCVCLEGGQSFTGCLRLDRGAAGSPSRPISIGSYGSGRATILAGDGSGIHVRDTMGVSIHDVIVAGSGSGTNGGSGIVFENDLAGDLKLPFIRIDRVEVSGFGDYGVLVVGGRGKSGFRDIRITNVVAHDNALAGIYVRGKFSRYAAGYAHENVYVGTCQAHDNPGVAGTGRENSGSGIVVSNVEGGVIEHCAAWQNGRCCDSAAGGPVGVWVWDANNVTVQCNESYGNVAGGPDDGGGFDLDGGVTNSVMQYNYSHDNDGPGYMLCQFASARRFGSNVVRYNISQNDGRKNRYGGIHLHDDNYAGGVRDCQIYNNTVYTSPSPGASPSALFVQFSAVSDVCVRNNIFQTDGGVGLATVLAGQHSLRLEGNCYYSGAAAFQVLWEEVPYPSLAAWRAGTGQERMGSQNLGFSICPGLRAPGRGGALRDPALLPTLSAYRLADNSPLIGAGLDMASLFGIDPGATDFFGAALPSQGGFAVGAHYVDRLRAGPGEPTGGGPHE
jgi:peptidoglycan/LPS O-acetylase OafA/YrhL